LQETIKDLIFKHLTKYVTSKYFEISDRNLEIDQANRRTEIGHVGRFLRRFGREGGILVIPPGERGSWRGTQTYAIQGVLELQDILCDLGYRLRRVRSDQISENLLKENIISIGGPIPNDITKELLNKSEINYKFNGNEIFSKKTSKIEFSPLMDNESIKRDYGIITKMKNPYNRKKECVIVCGCLGWGTQACLKVLTEKEDENVNFLNKYEYFQLICTCEIDGLNVGNYHFIVDLHPNDSIRRETIMKLY
jgi:hypothetical protein